MSINFYRFYPSATSRRFPDGRYGNVLDFATTGDTPLDATNITDRNHRAQSPSAITDRNFIPIPKRAGMPGVTWQAFPHACVSTEGIRDVGPDTVSDLCEFLDSGPQDEQMEHPRGPFHASGTPYTAALRHPEHPTLS